jgi:hypothetical protein
MQNNSQQISYRCPKCSRLIQTTLKHLMGKICFSCRPKQEKIDISALSVDIHNLTKKLARRLTADDYIKHGKYQIRTLYRLFGKDKWDEILSTLGYKTPKATYSYQQVVEELERVAKQLTKFPTLEQYSQLAKIDADIVKRVLKVNDWVEVLAKVFNIPTQILEQVLNPKHHYYQEQVSKLKTIANKLRRVPTIEEASKYGVSVDLLMKRLNKNWLELLAMAQIDLDIEINSEVTSLNLTHRLISKEDMLKDLNLIATQIGYYPSELKYDLLGSYSSTDLKYRFDRSWIGIIDLAKLNKQDYLATDSITKEKFFLNKTIVEFLDNK